MSEPTNEIRVQIIQAIKTLVETAFGPTAETQADRVYRSVTAGAWTPGGKAPRCVISDAGQQGEDIDRADAQGQDPSQPYDLESRRTLRIQLTLDLPAQWDRPASYIQWINHIERLTGLICAADLNVAGIETTHYIDDDLWTATLQSGASIQIWTLNYETDYWVTLST